LFKEINDEIEKLTGILSGQQLAPEQEEGKQEEGPMQGPETRPVEGQTQSTKKSSAGRNMLPNDTIIPINGTSVSLGDIRQMLTAKKKATYRIPDDKNKYLIALEKLRTVTTVEEVIATLGANSIKWSQIDPGKIDGGGTHKRNGRKWYSTRKKQRGGFTYDKANQFFGNKKSSSSSSTSKTSKSKSSINKSKKSTRRSKR
jgi:hypothetical protein